MRLVVVLLVMNHQYMATNHLKLSFTLLAFLSVRHQRSYYFQSSFLITNDFSRTADLSTQQLYYRQHPPVIITANVVPDSR